MRWTLRVRVSKCWSACGARGASERAACLSVGARQCCGTSSDCGPSGSRCVFLRKKSAGEKVRCLSVGSSDRNRVMKEGLYLYTRHRRPPCWIPSLLLSQATSPRHATECTSETRLQHRSCKYAPPTNVPVRARCVRCVWRETKKKKAHKSLEESGGACDEIAKKYWDENYDCEEDDELE